MRRKQLSIDNFLSSPYGAYHKVSAWTSHPDFCNRTQPLVVEIGPGNGDMFTWIVKNHPNCYPVAVDKRLDRLYRTSRKLEWYRYALVADDYWRFLAALPDSSVEKLYIHFPNFWPVRKDWKHRFFQLHSFVELARVLVPGGIIELKTDEKEYMDWTRTLAYHHRKSFTEIVVQTDCPLDTEKPLSAFEERWRKEWKSICLLQLQKK